MAKSIPQIKRPTIPTEVAERFIAAPAEAVSAAPLSVVKQPAAEEADDKPASVASSQSPKTRRATSNGRKVSKLSTGEEVRKVTVYLPAELDIALSVHCATNGLMRSDVVVAALRKVVKTQP